MFLRRKASIDFFEASCPQTHPLFDVVLGFLEVSLWDHWACGFSHALNVSLEDKCCKAELT